MEDRRHGQLLLSNWGDQGWLKKCGKNLRIGCSKVFMTKKCKHCNCDCHCSLKEHGDMYGVCSCLRCEHDMEECEACQ